jgi:transcriptional regulator with XRE-family HTH domain
LKNLVIFRKAKRWSQKKLADKAGISQTYISELEAEKKQPTIPIVEKLASALGVSISKILNQKSQFPKMIIG